MRNKIDFNAMHSAYSLTDINRNFKIFAGPGAGKTTWLVKHLETVLKTSKRLGKTKKIACITYTNVAAEEIRNRLKCDKSRFDISTIHSFLYRNIIKPFSFLIEKIEQDEKGVPLLNITKLNGHEEHIVSENRLRRWFKSIGKNLDSYYRIRERNNKNKNKNKKETKEEIRKKMVKELSSLDYKLVDGNAQLFIRNRKGAGIPQRKGELWEYKKRFWKDGIMHHEDVLFFSYRILSNYPSVLRFIRSKFPYLFIDEFQDTTELQTWILNAITESTTTIGVVGDLAQSIYMFTGAKRSDFISFKTESCANYKLTFNHRSTRKIIAFLNTFRNDLTQEGNENTIEGAPVKVVIGDIKAAREWCDNGLENPLYILTRRNESISAIEDNTGAGETSLIKELFATDSAIDRADFIYGVLKGYKFQKKKDFKNALNEVLKPLKRINEPATSKVSLRKAAIYTLKFIMQDGILNTNVFDFYSHLTNTFKNVYKITPPPNLKSRKLKAFYENHLVKDFLPYIKVNTKSADLVRTIHSAKGAQFNNVLVHFEKSNDFRKYILNASNEIDSEQKDDARIYYVACSRAKKNLFINIPEATEEDVRKIEELGIEIHRL